MKNIPLEEALELSETAKSEKTGAWRWGTVSTYVAELDGKNYEFTIRYHSEQGAFDSNSDNIDLCEVEPIEVKTTEWVRVKQPEPVPASKPACPVTGDGA